MPLVCEAVDIGELALETLSEETNSKSQPVRVMGLTSRGAYLKTARKWMVFISAETYKGPLTINLGQAKGAWPALSSRLSVGDAAQVYAAGISFGQAVISTAGARLWRPSPATPPVLGQAARHKKLAVVAERALASKSGVGLCALLSRLPGLAEARQALPDFYPERVAPWRLQEYIQDKDMPGLAQALPELLGVGPGLTPCGDDFLLGLLLALNRWRDVLAPGVKLEHLNQRLVQAAYQKTATLSANLIECAAMGLADERLIEALDALVKGWDGAWAPIERLLGWGSSSGVDVLVGFVFALWQPKP